MDIECFGPRAEAVARFFTKGRPIFVEGRLKLDQWESKEGEKEVHLGLYLIISSLLIRNKKALLPNLTRQKPKLLHNIPNFPTPPPSNDVDLDEDVPLTPNLSILIMAQTEILLLKHIDKLGAEGDVVKLNLALPEIICFHVIWRCL